VRVIRQEMERYTRTLGEGRMDGALAAQSRADELALGEQGGDVGGRDGRCPCDEMALEVLRRG